MGILPIVLVGCVLWLGALRSGNFADIGINFAVVLMFIRQPIGNLVHQVEVALHAKIAFKHLNALELPPSHNLGPAVELCQTWNTLYLKDVTYRYTGNDKFSLGPINLQIKRGEITFLVGSNGAGKSTLLKILCGLMTPVSGEIFVDGKEINKDNRRQYRAMFSAVLSDFHLFDNVPGKNEYTNGRKFETIVSQLELEGVLAFHDEKIDTTSLSTGQKKRLAMVVAWLDNKSILVLDEWAADQDPGFRKIFYEEMLPQLKSEGVTLIVISHDDRYFHTADTIVCIESGVVCN